MKNTIRDRKSVTNLANPPPTVDTLSIRRWPFFVGLPLQNTLIRSFLHRCSSPFQRRVYLAWANVSLARLISGHKEASEREREKEVRPKRAEIIMQTEKLKTKMLEISWLGERVICVSVGSQ